MLVSEETRAFCVGRHLINLPVDFEPVLPISATFRISGKSSRATSIEIRVREKDASLLSFQKAVSMRQGEIMAFANETTDILKETIKSQNGDVLFRILRIGDSYSSELHTLKATSYITLVAKSHQGRFLEIEQQILDYAKESLIPIEERSSSRTGFCLGAALLSGEHEGEIANFEFRSAMRPGVAVTVDIDTYTRDARADLLSRVSGPDSLLKIFDVQNKVLRQGERTVAGMKAQEWLSTVMLGENREQKQASFVLETMRPKPGPENPHIRVEMEVTPEGAIPSDHQLIELWDSITKTVRFAGPSEH